MDKDVQGWDIKKEDVETARKNSDEDAMHDSAADLQNPLKKFYEQYGQEFGLRQSGSEGPMQTMVEGHMKEHIDISDGLHHQQM